MEIFWNKIAWEDLFWQVSDKKVVLKINALIKECQHTPYEWPGKPEPLRHNRSGFWSRRIYNEDRLVYKIEEDVFYIAQGRYHY